MRRFILSLSCFLMMLAAPISAQDFDNGFAAHKKGDYATALKEWKPLADAGFITPQSNFGVMYANGQGVPQDYKEAVKWNTLAAEQGSAYAQFNVGNMYYKGRGVPKDYREALKWYTLVPKQGYAEAQSNIGVSYAEGEGVLSDFVMAHMWCNIAVANGNENGAKNRKTVAENMTSEDISKA